MIATNQRLGSMNARLRSERGHLPGEIDELVDPFGFRHVWVLHDLRRAYPERSVHPRIHRERIVDRQLPQFLEPTHAHHLDLVRLRLPPVLRALMTPDRCASCSLR